MRVLRDLGIVAIGIVMFGCATTQHVTDTSFRPPEGNYKLLVMQPDISVGVLTAGGQFEYREDWTQQARKNILDALAGQQSKRGGTTKVAATREETGADPALVADLVWLHNAVGQAIRMHKFAPQPLPTKKNKFDWTLGARAVEFGKATQYDYALFLHAQDSFSSGGRVALQAFAMLGCGFGVCVMPTGGMQVAFASLVDLKTGNVVWFNALAAGAGDIRTPAGAQAMVTKLLASMNADSKGQKRRT